MTARLDIDETGLVHDVSAPADRRLPTARVVFSRTFRRAGERAGRRHGDG